MNATLATAHQRILPGVAATLEVQWRNAHGEPAAAAEPVTVTVTSADGTELLADASATATTAGFDAGTVYQATLPATANVGLDELTCVWTDDDGATAITTVAVVGGIYATVTDVRRSDTSLGDAGKYPEVDIRRRRIETEFEFERSCGQAFVPRFTRMRMSGSGGPVLALPAPMLRRIRWVREYGANGSFTTWPSARVSDVAASAAGTAVLANDYWPSGLMNLEVAWEHGWDIPPDDIRRVALIRIRSLLNANKSGIPDRATSFTVSEGGTFSIATPGMRGSITGIPDVDVVLTDWTWGGVDTPAYATLSYEPGRYSVFHRR